MRQNEHGEPLDGSEFDQWHDPVEVKRLKRSITLPELIGVVFVVALVGAVILKIGGVL